MKISRRALLGKALALTAAGVLLPEAVAAEPERRVWAFPQNPIAKPIPPFYIGDVAMWHQRWDGPWTDALHYNFPQRLHFSDLYEFFLREEMQREKLQLERALQSGWSHDGLDDWSGYRQIVGMPLERAGSQRVQAGESITVDGFRVNVVNAIDGYMTLGFY